MQAGEQNRKAPRCGAFSFRVPSSAGAILGLVLYLLNFDLLSSIFPWLAELRSWDTLAAPVVFGIAAALLYWRLKRAATED